jgi:hypothetical protein
LPSGLNLFTISFSAGLISCYLHIYFRSFAFQITNARQNNGPMKRYACCGVAGLRVWNCITGTTPGNQFAEGGLKTTGANSHQPLLHAVQRTTQELFVCPNKPGAIAYINP